MPSQSRSSPSRPSRLADEQIAALAERLGDLDYYELLEVRPDATPREIKTAYHASSRRFHPDGHRHLEAGVRAAVERISRRVTEAYSVLRDPDRRPAYDRYRATGGGVRMQLAEARAEAVQQRREAEGRTPQGRQYFNLASADLRREDFASAARNLQTALTFEPGNEGFKALLASVRQKLR